MSLLAATHLLHILSGIVYLGGIAATAFALFPALARMPGETAATFYREYGSRIGPIVGIASLLVIVTGLLRAWLGGGMTQFPDLVSPYGLLVLAAVAVFVVDGFLGGRSRARFEAALERLKTDDSEPVRAELGSIASTHKISTSVTMLAVATLMTILGLGLY